jgi:glyoxylase-like metal-dependent hydrolase (beta-lactamase superfamily II)
MTTRFHTLRLGQVNAYLIQGREGYMLVDAGFPRREKVLFAWLKEKNIHPHEIRLIVITHVHFDHVGSVQAIQAGTGSSVAVPEGEAGLLEHGEVAIPPGTRWFSRPFLAFARQSPFIKSWFRFQALKPDLLLRGETSLEAYGFSARVLPTPGHTLDSVSVLTEDGLAFVGDLAPNDLPFGLGPIYNSFGEDGPMMLRSWETLLRAGVRNILPAHGKPFDAARLEGALRVWKKKLGV